MTNESTSADRRPLNSRGKQWARTLAAWLVSAGIAPNQISLFSVVAALLGLLFLWLSVSAEVGLQAIYFVLAAIACQLRLICNLMDGMVAIEGGKKAPDGALWNEMPDRVADIAILVGLGVAADAIVAGWIAATLAVTIAYVRELGKGIDGFVDFSGPMAKPQRMALVTIVLLMAAIATLLVPHARNELFAMMLLELGLWLCIAGSVLTVWRRTRHIQRRLISG